MIAAMGYEVGRARRHSEPGAVRGRRWQGTVVVGGDTSTVLGGRAADSGEWRRGARDRGSEPPHEPGVQELSMTTPTASAYLQQVVTRLEQLNGPPHRDAIERAVELVVAALADGGIVQAFGTGHSQGFVMEIAGCRRADPHQRHRAARRGALRRPRRRGARLHAGARAVDRRRAVGCDADPPCRRVLHRLQLRRQRLDRRHGRGRYRPWPQADRGDEHGAHDGGRAQAPERQAADRLRRRRDRQPRRTATPPSRSMCETAALRPASGRCRR